MTISQGIESRGDSRLKIRLRPSRAFFNKTILGRLPPEILRNIIMELDCFSVRTLMATFKEIRKLFILLTDACDCGPRRRFFAMKGVETCSIGAYNSEKYVTSKPLIQLFEAFTHWPDLKSAGKCQHLCHKLDFQTVFFKPGKGSIIHPFLNRYSFLIIRDLNLWYHHGSPRVMDRLYSTGAKVLFLSDSLNSTRLYDGTSGDFSNDKGYEMQLYTAVHVTSVQFQLHYMLESLEIHTLERIERLSFPRLLFLLVHLRSPIDSSGARGRPILRDISAPELRILEIFYDSDFPIIGGIKARDDIYLTKLEKRQNLCYTSKLSLIDTSVGDDVRRVTQPKYDYEEIRNSVDLDFVRGFGYVHVFGGPAFLLSLMNLTKVHTLHWRLSELIAPGESNGVPESLETTNLGKFFFETSVPNVKLPKLVCRLVEPEEFTPFSQNAGMHDLGIVTFAPGLDVSNLLGVNGLVIENIKGLIVIDNSQVKEMGSCIRIPEGTLMRPTGWIVLILKGCEISKKEKIHLLPNTSLRRQLEFVPERILRLIDYWLIEEPLFYL